MQLVSKNQKFILVVKRGCVNQDILVNGNKNDGEGCEEILGHAALSRTHTRILCMCHKDLCNHSTRDCSITNMLIYVIIFNIIANI